MLSEKEEAGKDEESLAEIADFGQLLSPCLVENTAVFLNAMTFSKFLMRSVVPSDL